MKFRPPLLTLSIAAAAIVAQIAPEFATALEFNRAAIARGECWRFITAHLTHFDFNHFAWDLAVFVSLGSICEQSSRRRLAATLLLASVMITAAIGWWQPHFTSYRGLSGLDCALFGIFSGTLLQRRDSLAKFVGILGLLGVLAKCSAELATGVTLFTTGASYAPVPLSHLIGAVAGVIGSRWLVAAKRPLAQGPRELFTSLRQKSCSPDPRPCP